MTVPAALGAALDWPLLVTLALMVPGLVAAARLRVPVLLTRTGPWATLARVSVTAFICFLPVIFPDTDDRYFCLVLPLLFVAAAIIGRVLDRPDSAGADGPEPNRHGPT